MRRLLPIALLVALFVSFAGPAEAAVRLRSAKCPFDAAASFKVTGAKGTMEGVASEYEWLKRNRPGWRRDSVATVSGPKGRIYDLLYISKGRKKQTICFDVTEFFGMDL